MWFPSNLIYDKFGFDLDLRLEHSEFPHSVVTNGKVDAKRDGQSQIWHIAYPNWFTSFSPLLELVPDDRVAKYAGTLHLPNGQDLELDIVKEAALAVDLPTIAKDVETYATTFTESTGKYPHGDRLTVYLWSNPDRSMEYDGATTTNVESLEHELFHSWYGRGVKPASQVDSWIDEAWDRYNTHPTKRFEVKPLDPAAPPVTLSPANPWYRITPDDSYALGRAFFAGLAAEMGLDPLRAAMKAFYGQRTLGLITTAELEKYLYDTSSNPAVKAAFNRFVYGRADVASNRAPLPVREPANRDVEPPRSAD